MTESELDTVYTQLCKTMTEVGEGNAQLFLARFALLSIQQIGDAGTALALIAQAGEEMGQ